MQIQAPDDRTAQILHILIAISTVLNLTITLLRSVIDYLKNQTKE